jgi:hypothetical protein
MTLEEASKFLYDLVKDIQGLFRQWDQLKEWEKEAYRKTVERIVSLYLAKKAASIDVLEYEPIR